MIQNDHSGRTKSMSDTARKRISLSLALITLLLMMLTMSGCSPEYTGEPTVRAAFKVCYLTEQYTEVYDTAYYTMYDDGRSKKTDAFKPCVSETYMLKGVDYKGIDKPIEWDKLIDSRGNTVTPYGDMQDILSIMYGEYGDETYPFDNFVIFRTDEGCYLYIRNYVSVHTIYRYDSAAKKLTMLGKIDDGHIMELIGIAGLET